MGSTVGLLYGLTIPLFWNELPMEGILILCLVLTGLNISPLLGNAISYPVYLFVPIFTFTPIAIKSMLIGGYFWFLTVLCITGIIGFLLYAKRFSKTFNENFYLRIQNEILAQNLQKEKENIEKVSRAKMQFLAAASHDLRQPLQAQRMLAESIKMQTKNSELSQLSEQMMTSQLSMQSMLDSLLDISRLDAGIIKQNPVSISLHHLFDNLAHEFEPLAKKKDLNFYVHWPPQDAVARCDLGLIESIIRNLLSNAIRYTNKGSVMLAIRKRKHYWRVEIRDSGIGISQEKQSVIFEEFKQLHNSERDRSKGLGLGLSIVKRLCQLLNYQLTLYSRHERGSVFSFTIPIEADASEKIHNDITHEINIESLTNISFLLIDDLFEIREALSKAFLNYGLLIRTCATLNEAIAMTKTKVPDIIIADYRLVNEENGWDVIIALRELTGIKIPAVILTGDTEPEKLVLLESTSCPILHKPISMDKLLNTIMQIKS